MVGVDEAQQEAIEQSACVLVERGEPCRIERAPATDGRELVHERTARRDEQGDHRRQVHSARLQAGRERVDQCDRRGFRLASGRVVGPIGVEVGSSQRTDFG